MKLKPLPNETTPKFTTGSQWDGNSQTALKRLPLQPLRGSALAIPPSPVRVLLRFADALLAAPATNETTTTRHTTHKWSCSNDFYRVSFEAAAVAKVYGVVASPGRFVVVVVVISIAPLSLCDHS